MQQHEDAPETFHTRNLTELNTWRWRVPGSQSCCPGNWRKGKKYHGRGTRAGKGSEVPGTDGCHQSVKKIQKFGCCHQSDKKVLVVLGDLGDTYRSRCHRILEVVEMLAGAVGMTLGVRWHTSGLVEYDKGEEPPMVGE